MTVKSRSYDEAQQKQFCAEISAFYGTDIVTSKQVDDFVKAKGYKNPRFLAADTYKAGWGKFRVAGDATDSRFLHPANVVREAANENMVATAVANVLHITDGEPAVIKDNFIPEKEPGYVPFGFYNNLKGIIASKIFYPVYITGLSGNGKTLMVAQACNEAQRELIRVNITKETDEFDLIGAYELVNGDTKWRDGPVVVAMKRGAVLLLDETDYGSERLLCLQPILEGKGYFNKKRGEYITPAPGFNVMATANTKGKGSDDGRFIGANVLNDAFLERFAITVEQEYPSEKTERSILEKLFNELKPEPELNVTQFAAHLAKWAEMIRQGYAAGSVSEVISTRRLTHIVRAYCIFKTRRKAIELCLNRFDNEVKTVYMDFYSKIDADLDKKIVFGQKNVAQAPAQAAKVAPAATAQDPLVALRKNAHAAAANQPPVAPKPASSPMAPAKTATTAAGNKKDALLALRQAAGKTTTFDISAMTFGDPRNVAAVSSKYKHSVRCIRNKATGGAEVTAFGIKRTISASDILAATGDLLDQTVEEMAKLVATGG